VRSLLKQLGIDNGRFVVSLMHPPLVARLIQSQEHVNILKSIVSYAESCILALKMISFDVPTVRDTPALANIISMPVAIDEKNVYKLKKLIHENLLDRRAKFGGNHKLIT
jgi:hypothetical protein